MAKKLTSRTAGEGARRAKAAGRRIDPPPGQYASDEEACLYDDFYRKQRHIPPPQRVADVVSKLLTKRGYANVQQKSELLEVWNKAAGALIAKHTRPGKVTRGTWEIVVRNSSLLQELSFQQTAILRAVQQAVPEQKIQKLKFKVGPIE
jgi:hypothetical protein